MRDVEVVAVPGRVDGDAPRVPLAETLGRLVYSSPVPSTRHQGLAVVRQHHLQVDLVATAERPFSILTSARSLVALGFGILHWPA